VIALGQRETDNIAQMITIAGFIFLVLFYNINVKLPNLDLQQEIYNLERERGRGERETERQRDREINREREVDRDIERESKA
jgi:hypothetical protein